MQKKIKICHHFSKTAKNPYISNKYDPSKGLNNPWAPNWSTRLTRGLWYRLGTVHDLETKVDMSSHSFQISVWTAHHA